jgi:hypothetical protein
MQENAALKIQKIAGRFSAKLRPSDPARPLAAPPY